MTTSPSDPVSLRGGRRLSALVALALLPGAAGAEPWIMWGGQPWEVVSASAAPILGEVALDVTMRSLGTLPPDLPDELFLALCDGLLAAPPAVDGLAAGATPFRIAVNVLGPDGPVFPFGLAMAVEGGACVEKGDTNPFLVTWPGSLAPWWARSFTMASASPPTLRASFSPAEGVVLAAADMPAALACQAFLEDPHPVFRDALDQIRPEVIEIMARVRTEKDGVPVDETAATAFDVSGGACLPIEETVP